MNDKIKTTHSSGENYLKAVFLIEKEKGTARSVDVADYLGVSKPSVTRAIKILSEGGLLFKDADGCLHLTDVGRETAEQVYEQYCYFKEHLMNAGVDEQTANREACTMEHAITPDTFRQIKNKKHSVGTV